MTNNLKTGAALCVLALLGLKIAIGVTTHADDHDEIIVTGRYLYADQINALKSPTPIIDVPQSLSIVTADQIQIQGFTSIGDIIAYTPGVNTSMGEGHRDAVVFRGVRSTADFYIDGMRDDVQYYRPLYNLKQVEILRGPNALLFGRGGTGGILNRVTKKGVIGESFTSFAAGVDSFGAFDVQLDSNFEVSDSSALRLNGFYEQLDNHRDFFDGERFGFNPALKTKLGSSTLLNLSYEYADHERFIDRGIPTGSDGRPVEALSDFVFADPEINTSFLQAHLLRAKLQHEFSDNLKANVSAFYADYDKFYQNFYVSGYDQAVTPDEVTLDGYVDITERQNFMIASSLIGEAKTGGVSHTLMGGAEIIRTSSDQDRYNAFWDTTLDDNEIFSIARPLSLLGGSGINAAGLATSNDFSIDINDDTRVQIDVFSAYIQDEIALSDMFDIVVGARFDSFDIEVNNVVAGEIRSRKDEEISPRLGAIFKPKENVSLYGSYSQTFLPRSGEQFANINGSNNALDPDKYTNIEAGLKWDIRQGLSLTAALFEIEQSSPQTADNDPSTLDIIDSQTQGYEVQLQGQLTDDWFVSGGYSYLGGEIVDRNGPTGARPRELPEHMASLWNSYQLTERFGLGLGVTYQGESFINNGNSAVLPAYTRFDASAFYDVSEDLRLQLNIENLTDTLYFPNAHSTHQVGVGAPLHARLSVRGNF